MSDRKLSLIVDDTPTNVAIITGVLEDSFAIKVATNGEIALGIAQAPDKPDLVLLDVEMPGMDGFELTRHVRQNPLTAHIPVIMITAADERHREVAKHAGVSVLLGQPYPEEELIAHIRRAMNHGEKQAGALA